MDPVTTGFVAGPETWRLPFHSLSSPLPRTKKRFGMSTLTSSFGPDPEEEAVLSSCPASTTFSVGMLVPNELTIWNCPLLTVMAARTSGDVAARRCPPCPKG